MKLRFTPRAVGDLSAIADFLRERNPAAARQVQATIFNSLKNLLVFPRVGRPQGVAGIRKLVTRKYPYLVYYSIDESEGEITILAIQHPARKREYQDI